MGKIVRVYVFDLRGRPLLADIEEEEPEPYRRNLAGFHMRGSDEPAHRSRVLGPSVESDDEDAEAIELEVEAEDEEEDEP